MTRWRLAQNLLKTKHSAENALTQKSCSTTEYNIDSHADMLNNVCYAYQDNNNKNKTDFIELFFHISPLQKKFYEITEKNWSLLIEQRSNFLPLQKHLVVNATKILRKKIMK